MTERSLIGEVRNMSDYESPYGKPNLYIQLVVGQSREDPSPYAAWTTIPMRHTPSGWVGYWEGEIEGKSVHLGIMTGCDTPFDIPDPA